MFQQVLCYLLVSGEVGDKNAWPREPPQGEGH